MHRRRRVLKTRAASPKGARRISRALSGILAQASRVNSANTVRGCEEDQTALKRGFFILGRLAISGSAVRRLNPRRSSSHCDPFARSDNPKRE